MFIYLFKRERTLSYNTCACTNRRGAERGRKAENPKHTPPSQHRADLGPEPMNLDKSQQQRTPQKISLAWNTLLCFSSQPSATYPSRISLSITHSVQFPLIPYPLSTSLAFSLWAEFFFTPQLSNVKYGFVCSIQLSVSSTGLEFFESSDFVLIFISVVPSILP